MICIEFNTTMAALSASSASGSYC